MIKIPSNEEYIRAGGNAELIAWLAQLRDTKKFPIANRPTNWFIDRILEELKQRQHRNLNANSAM